MYIYIYIYTYIQGKKSIFSQKEFKHCFLYKTDVCNVLLANSEKTILRFPFFISLFKFA